MNDYERRLQDVLDDVRQIIEDKDDRVKMFLIDIFNLLFWKNHIEGYVDPNTKYELAGLFDLYTEKISGCDTWYSFDSKDMDHVYAVISKVRGMIGLKEDLLK